MKYYVYISLHNFISVITSNYCIIGNVPLNATQESVEDILSQYQRWTFATVMEHDNDEKELGDNDSDDENNNEKIKKPSLEYQFAKIEFDDPQSLQIFLDDVKKNQIMIGYNTVSLLRHDTVCFNQYIFPTLYVINICIYITCNLAKKKKKETSIIRGTYDSLKKAKKTEE